MFLFAFQAVESSTSPAIRMKILKCSTVLLPYRSMIASRLHSLTTVLRACLLLVVPHPPLKSALPYSRLVVRVSRTIIPRLPSLRLRLLRRHRHHRRRRHHLHPPPLCVATLNPVIKKSSTALTLVVMRTLSVVTSPVLVPPTYSLRRRG